MKKTILTALVFLFAVGIAMPQAAEARVFVSARFGGCCGYGYYGGYYPYPAYYYPYYVAPPPVVYAVPPATVYEAAPAATVITQAPPPAARASSSETFIDSAGRTCRHYEGPAPGSLNTACLQPDGTWHTVK